MKKNLHLPILLLLLCMGTTACIKEKLTGNGNSDGNGNGASAQLAGFDSDGMSKYSYSVSSFKRVGFSRGNLQYQASTNTWRFAEHQYDCIGQDNTLISPVNSEWIDLFGWGTSGWNSGAVAYQPYSTSTDDTNYWPGGDRLNDLTDETLYADWGVYNSITNGGNKQGVWHTLNSSEWRYLLGQTGAADRQDKWGMAKLMGIYCGLIILPDNWTLPSGLSFTPGAKTWETNKYTDEEWEKMEAAGAIFLPAAGRRHNVGVDDNGTVGYYWSTTHYLEFRAYNISFSSGSLDMVNRNYRSTGLSVRLVKTK